ncbi:MAG: hypothetical protein WEB03_15980 [Nitriliruptor sp.]|uniref:hypothetical protein n=1 Tax=Nitriliruptor sp. TaxID=2448056 RepID=UPI0034A062F3
MSASSRTTPTMMIVSLEAAQAAGAALIVSGDRHLLSRGRWGEVAILRPAVFLADFGLE